MDELPLPAKLPQPQPELPAGMIEQIDKFLSNPLFQIAAKSHVGDIQQFIKENSGEYEELVYGYINSKYPNIYAIIKPEEDTPKQNEDEPEDEEEPEPVIKPVPQSEINFQIWQMHLEGYSATEISDFLSEKFDRDIYAMHVGRQIKRMQAALAAQNKPQDKPEIKQVIPAIRTQTLTETSTPKPAIPQDADSLIVMSTLAGCINFWNKIKIYVLMTIAGVAGYILK